VIDEIRAKFLPRFVDAARQRLARASELIGSGSFDGAAIAAELHTIAGEASIMGLAEIAGIAREGERAVRQVGGIDDTGMLRAIERLSRGIEELARGAAG
jgi:HPt (histidine-containing phosphotransfer) domain-containing protein